MKPCPEGLCYWTADQAAECLSLSAALYTRLWYGFVGKGDCKPLGGDGSPDRNGRRTTEEPIVSVEYDDCMEKVWPKLTDAERDELEAAYLKEYG